MDQYLTTIGDILDWAAQFKRDQVVHVQLKGQDQSNVWIMGASGFSFGKELDGSPRPGITIGHPMLRRLPESPNEWVSND